MKEIETMRKNILTVVLFLVVVLMVIARFPGCVLLGTLIVVVLLIPEIHVLIVKNVLVLFLHLMILIVVQSFVNLILLSVVQEFLTIVIFQ